MRFGGWHGSRSYACVDSSRAGAACPVSVRAEGAAARVRRQCSALPSSGDGGEDVDRGSFVMRLTPSARAFKMYRAGVGLRCIEIARPSAALMRQTKILFPSAVVALATVMRVPLPERTPVMMSRSMNGSPMFLFLLVRQLTKSVPQCGRMLVRR